MGLFRPGDHGSTFGGNPLGSAIARAALDVLIEDGLVERSREVGAYFMGRLRRLESEHIKEVRGKGLLIGVEMNSLARPFCDELRDASILCKDTHGTVVRFAPPLVISKEEIDWAMERIEPILADGH
jgi:ornithine--oxo-acid transaminase